MKINGINNNNFLDYSKKPNRFTFLGADEDANQSYNFDKQRDNMRERERERSNNIFLTNKSNVVNKAHQVSRTPSLISKSNKFSNIKPNCELTDADFPELGVQSIKHVDQNINENISFKDAINVFNNNDVNITINSENNIDPGWVQIHTINKQIVFKYGHNSTNNNNNEHTQKYVEHNMNNAIATMSTNWDKYRTNYDELNGEGSYDDVYYLSQNYEDTVSETEAELDNDSEYSDTNY